MINLQAEKREENPENEHDHGATVGALVDAGVPDLLDDDDGLGACAWNKACVRGARRGEFGVRHGISHAHTVTSWADKTYIHVRIQRVRGSRPHLAAVLRAERPWFVDVRAKETSALLQERSEGRRGARVCAGYGAGIHVRGGCITHRCSEQRVSLYSKSQEGRQTREGECLACVKLPRQSNEHLIKVFS